MVVSGLLTLENRGAWQSLLSARVFSAERAAEPAIIYVESGQDDVIVTGRAFRQAVEVYAGSLWEKGTRPGHPILIAHTQNLESIYAFWACLTIGAIPAMFPILTEKLNPTVYLNNLAQLTRLSDIQAILTTDHFAPQLAPHVPCAVYPSSEMKEIRDQRLEIEPSNRQSPISNPQLPAPDPQSIAFLQHSSGTTGLQKGVALSHEAALNQLASYSHALSLSEDDVVVSWLPLYHDMGLIAGFLLPLVQGIPLVLMSPFDWVRRPALLFQAIQQHNGTLCWLPNFAYNHCARRIRQRDLDGLSVASMRLFINCSEPVHHQSHALFLSRFAALGARPDMLGVSYAMAENTFAVTQTAPGREPQHDIINQHILENDRLAQPVPATHPHATTKVSCGPPISGTQLQVLDEAGQPLPERHIGELALTSPYMLTEYYRRPDLQPFAKDGWFRTGDMGYLADGEVYIVGRKKDLIINAGKNVYPQDIEAIVNGVEGIRPGRVVIFGVWDERDGTELLAVVAEVDDELDPAGRKQLNRALRQAIAQQSDVTLTYISLVPPQWLLKTSSGKIARSANRDKWQASR